MENMTPSIQKDEFSKSCVLWYKIEQFMKIGHVSAEDVDSFPDQIIKFTNNIKDFYTCGASSFLTNKDIGSEETFYLHALRYYIPGIATNTWSEHKAGIGIFTMQGYERRNKESKNTLRRYNNNKAKKLPQNLNRLYDIFHNE